MLKYKIKLTDNNFKQEKLVWGEKYLAPDLSFVSGVTSQNYHLEKFSRVPLINSIINNTNSIANIETNNVTRQGYIIIKNKQYEVNKGTVVDYSVDSGGIVADYKYLVLNGKYYYAYKGENEEYTKFKINDWLAIDNLGNVGEEEIEVTCPSDGTDVDQIVKIDTVVWIEDDVVNIDGHNYFFERNIQIDENQIGGLKYYEDGACLDANELTKCDSIEYHPYKSSNDYNSVTKFILTKQEEVSREFTDISFCKRFYYVKYKNYYLPIILSGDTIQYFKCEVPNYVLGNITDKQDPLYYKTNYIDVYYQKNGETENSELTNEQLSGKTFEDIKGVDSYVIIDGEVFYVDSEIMNANDGREIAIYLKDDSSDIAIWDRLRLVDSSEVKSMQEVYPTNKYEFNSNDTSFVLYNGVKYKVEENICDKVLINGHEYSIDYINGKTKNEDCLVSIGDEKVPMKIIEEEDSKLKLERYGKIVSGNSNSAITAIYDIVPYSGITIGSNKYIIKQDGDSFYAYIDRGNEYTFIVNEIIGSSMLVCSLDVNNTDFTDDFIDFVSYNTCGNVVENKANMVLYTKNKIFGDKEITQELAFQNYVRPSSSDDYYDLFSSLEILVNNGYISLPISLNNSQGNNIIQDDIVNNQFFEEVKKRSINPIVDMEKDVYTPKYILNSSESIKAYKSSLENPNDISDIDLSTMYIGSYTDFHPIRDIRVNLHFRTRNLTSWKINDGYNDALSGQEGKENDNWFITDFHPYKNVLANSADTLMNTSDLIGLLYFTNDDVFYQHKNISKSFLRFSYYDTIDKQRQSLLATSCAFMNSHKMFKTFIDNSRKNINDFGWAIAPEYKKDDNGKYNMDEDIAKGIVTNKIDVRTEFLGTRQENKDKYLSKNNQYVTAFTGAIISDDNRIGSEFIINNKIETDTSSEGYYLYIFREYSENLMPKPVYMKVEFNHAGIGKTIPFIIPMKWSEPDENDGYKTPISALSLNDTSASQAAPTVSDLKLLKSGVKLEDVYAQTYIPLYAVYDFKNKEYAYVFDSRYVRAESKIVTLNLFELKVQNEEIPATASIDYVKAIQRTITMKKQPTAKININNKQFQEI